MIFNLLWQFGAVSFRAFLLSAGAVVLFCAIVWFLIKGFKPDASLSPGGIVVAAITSVLLLVQFVPAIGAYNLKGSIDEVSDFANQLINNELVNGGGYR